MTPVVFVLLIFPVKVRVDPVKVVEVDSKGWYVVKLVVSLVPTSAFEYTVAFVSTLLPLLVIVPFVEISPVFDIVHTTVDAEFLIVKGFVVFGVSISKGLVLTKVGLTVIPPVLPPEETPILTYPTPAEKSVNILLVPVKAVS